MISKNTLLRSAYWTLATTLLPLGTMHAQSAFPTPTHQVNRSSARTFLAGSGFENNSVATFQYLSSSNGWTLNAAGTGIVKDGFAFAAGRNFGGSYSLFLQRNLGSAKRTFNMSAGVYEFSFYGAQRLANGNYQRQTVEVLIDGQRVFRERLLPGGIRRYFSKPFRHSGGNVQVEIRGVRANGDHSAVLDYCEFNEVMNWNDSSIWSNGAVSTGINNSVLIPSGARVYIDSSRLVGNLRIQGSLSVLESSNLIQLQARNILVDGNYARLLAGSDGSPFTGRLALSFLGGSSTQNLEGFGSRFIGARLGGEIILHGRNVKNYVSLRQTAEAGATSVVITAASNWSVGDRILITSTAGAYNSTSVRGWDQAEVRTITGITALSNGRQRINFNGGLAHRHLGVSYSSQRNVAPTKTWTYEVRAQVANLTRNIKIEGAGPEIGSGLGVHMMVMGAHNGMPRAGRAKISNVHFFQVGQKGLTGRYPFHWHLLADDGDGQYLKNSVIEKSFNRMVTIHGTHRAEVVGNVGYDHVGHGVFFEDGAERFNRVNANLVAATKQAAAGEEVIPTDNGNNQLQTSFPSAFWITNPTNTIERNIVTGTTGTGYWFALNNSPTGASAADSRFNGIKPINSNLSSFKDNQTVSCSIGVDINDSVNATTLELVPNSAWHPASRPQNLDGTISIGNRVGLYTGLGNFENEVGFIRSKLIDNEMDTLLASYNTVRESIFVDRIPAALTGANQSAFHMYDGPGRSVNNHFSNYSANGASIVKEGGGAVTKTNWLFQGSSFNHSGFPRIAFNAANGNNNSSAHQADVVVDVDGRLSGVVGAAIVTPHPILRTNNNLPVPGNWSNAYLTEENYVSSMINYPGSGHAQRGQTMFTRVDNNTGERVNGYSHHPFINNSPLPLIVNNTRYHYEILFQGGLPQGGRFNMAFGDSVSGDNVLLKFPGLNTVSPTINGYPQRSSLNQLRNTSSSGYYRDGSHIWVKFVSTAPDYVTGSTFEVNW